MRATYLRRAALPATLVLALVASVASAACGGDDEALIVYSGRSVNLIGPMLDRFEEDTGIVVEGRYGSTAEMATTLLEEGDNSPADVFIAQDTGGLGAVAKEGLFEVLPSSILDVVDPRWRSEDGEWVGLSGRARVLVYNPDLIDESELPTSVMELTDPQWSGRFAWAPTNGSFQSFVSAMRVQHGEDATREWLQGVMDNDVEAYPNNLTIVDAVAAGEVEFGLVNHYYLHQRIDEEGEDFSARNYYTAPGDIGSLVNVAGAGILASSERKDDAERLLEFLLSEEAQEYFAQETFEFPVIEGVAAAEVLPDLGAIEPPAIDLDDLDDLEGTLALLREVGALE